jgi:hypothetical protein
MVVGPRRDFAGPAGALPPGIEDARPAVMAEGEQAPPDADIRMPNMARMYNHALGGKGNFASDREAVQNLFRLAPENAYVPRPTGSSWARRRASRKLALYQWLIGEALFGRVHRRTGAPSLARDPWD